jgi:predicted acetyltransferase
MTETYPIRTIDPGEFEALGDVAARAFGETWPPEAVEQERRIIEFDRTIGAFDGDRPVGSASAYTFTVTVPGGSSAAAGITLVGVLPMYRRRGILTALMRHLLADAASRGEPLAILYASESGIYGRYGFGMASSHQRFLIKRGEGRLAPGSGATDSGQPRLREAEPGQATAELAKVYGQLLPLRPGMIARDQRWWDNVVADLEFRRDGMSPLRCVIAEDDAGPRGYALYRTKLSFDSDNLPDGTLRVSEFMAADPGATAALWGDLLTRDLMDEVVAQRRPADDPLPALLADPRRARSSRTEGLWVRLVDVPAALLRRRYASPVDLVLDVTDPQIPGNTGRWRLRADGPAGGRDASCERTEAPADLVMPVRALGACYLGACCLSQLAEAGHILELTPGSLAVLTTAMSWHLAPHTSTGF